MALDINGVISKIVICVYVVEINKDNQYEKKISCIFRIYYGKITVIVTVVCIWQEVKDGQEVKQLYIEKDQRRNDFGYDLIGSCWPEKDRGRLIIRGSSYVISLMSLFEFSCLGLSWTQGQKLRKLASLSPHHFSHFLQRQ